MVVSVDLKIAPLNLDPWPSTGSIPSVDSTHHSAAAHTDLGQRQVDPLELQVAGCTSSTELITMCLHVSNMVIACS